MASFLASASGVSAPVFGLGGHDLQPRHLVAAFRALADLPMAMTAHVVFSAIDPIQPATTSATMIVRVIRGTIGFDGLLGNDSSNPRAVAMQFDLFAFAYRRPT